MLLLGGKPPLFWNMYIDHLDKGTIFKFDYWMLKSFVGPFLPYKSFSTLFEENMRVEWWKVKQENIEHVEQLK